MFTRRRYPITELLFSIVILGIVAAAQSGCSGNGYQSFVAASDTFVNQTAGPRLERYYAADISLAPETRQTYLDELAAFRATVDAAKRDGSSSP